MHFKEEIEIPRELKNNNEEKQPEKLTYKRGKYTDGQRVASNKYLRENYFSVKLKKSDKDSIKAAAEHCGMSMLAFITDAIYRRMDEVFKEQTDKNTTEESDVME